MPKEPQGLADLMPCVVRVPSSPRRSGNLRRSALARQAVARGRADAVAVGLVPQLRCQMATDASGGQWRK